MAHTDFERMVVEELKSIETGAIESILPEDKRLNVNGKFGF